MGERREPDTPGEGGMAQTDPEAAQKFHDADTRHMVHELQGTVGGLVASVQAIDRRLDRDSRKLDELSREISAVKELIPKIDDMLGFVKHGVPSLATKAEIERLASDISHRPTRRQSVQDLLAFTGFIAVLMAIFAFFARAH